MVKRLFLACWTLMAVMATHAQPPHSFFVIHCDPGYATPIHWNVLRRMVDSATAYNVPLTLEFSPQWVDMILADSAKLARVRSWQQNRHEVAGHHHGIYHCMWDSLTNYPGDSIAANQPVKRYINGQWVSNCDSGSLKSAMQPFYDALDSLAGDSLLLTWGASDEHPEVDLYPNLMYRTTGGRDTPTQGFSNPYVETYGPTALSTGTFGPYTVCLIDYYFLYDAADAAAMQAVYNDTAFSSQYKVAGVVTHVFNVKNQNANNPNNFFYQWLRFISGKGCKNVREIMRAEGCNPTVTTGVHPPASLDAAELFPNPAHETVSFQAPAGALPIAVEVVDVMGRVRKSFTCRADQASFSVADLPRGLYMVVLTSGKGQRAARLLVKQ